MKKIYLVDSENVGDVWVPLLVSSQPEDVVLVFYTQKSPHMNYENVRMLKETEKEAVFIKCFEGNNALDFQLVSELGYRLKEDADSEYVIVSNDTGFDAVVRYWSAKEMPVSRLSGKECYRQLVSRKQRGEQKQQEGTPERQVMPEETKKQTVPETEESVEEQTVPETGNVVERQDVSETENVAERQDVPEMAEVPERQDVPKADEVAQKLLTEKENRDGEDVVRTLFRCISKENLVDFHNALVAFLGEEEGKALYQEIKGNAEYTTYWSALPESSQKERFDIYCKLVFAHSEFAKEVPTDFSDFLYRSNGKRKNLNSLRAALQGQYGKDKGMKYYSLFKSHIKIMNRM